MKIDLPCELESPEVVCDVDMRVCTLQTYNLACNNLQGSRKATASSIACTLVQFEPHSAQHISTHYIYIYYVDDVYKYIRNIHSSPGNMNFIELHFYHRKMGCSGFAVCRGLTVLQTRFQGFLRAAFHCGLLEDSTG